jgi:hypothetical protein
MTMDKKRKLKEFFDLAERFPTAPLIPKKSSN